MPVSKERAYAGFAYLVGVAALPPAQRQAIVSQIARHMPRAYTERAARGVLEMEASMIAALARCKAEGRELGEALRASVAWHAQLASVMREVCAAAGVVVDKENS